MKQDSKFIKEYEAKENLLYMIPTLPSLINTDVKLTADEKEGLNELEQWVEANENRYLALIK